MLSFPRNFLFVLPSLFLFQTTLLASPLVKESVTVSVRAIQASHLSDPSPKRVSIVSKEASDLAMRDIRSKLKKLSYNRFDLISQQSKSVPFNQKETFVLGDGHVLTFKTISKKKDKVCLWLNWKDGRGMNVLDTQLHFVGGETVITGADGADNTGLIVAVDVR